MTLKTKLISIIVAFVMVVSLMLVGIFASSTITMQMGGNVSFTANGVYAEVTGTITGASGGQVTLPNVEIDYTDTTENITMPPEWTNMPLTFDENGSEITVSFTITNLATDRNIDTTITDITVANGFTVTRDCDGETISETDNRIITDSATYTFKLNVSSKNSPASGTFGINVHLENTTEEPQEGYTVTFDFSKVSRYLNDLSYTINGGEKISFADSSTTVYNVSALVIYYDTDNLLYNSISIYLDGASCGSLYDNSSDGTNRSVSISIDKDTSVSFRVWYGGIT